MVERPSILVAAAVAASAALVSAAAFVTTAAAQLNRTTAAQALTGTAASKTFTDPSGDSSGAPDITTVVVSDDGSTGMVTVVVTASGTQPPSADGLVRVVSVWLDTDSNASTGQYGADYVLQYTNNPADPAHYWAIGRWSGDSWRAPVTIPLSTSFIISGDALTWRVSRSVLGDPASLTFDVAGETLDASGNVTAKDAAPDSGQWSYTLAGPTRTMQIIYFPTIALPVTTPARPVAGKRLTVMFRVTSDAKPLADGTMICDPSIKGKVIAHAESFKAGVARLSFVVPENAKGKQLRVKVTIQAPSYEKQGAYTDGAVIGDMIVQYKGMATTKVVSFVIH